MSQALCILAAGRGSRLGDLTSNINKALLSVGNKAAISHIIDKAPSECEIVVAVGYDKEKVREYCEAAHPERSFIFVEVDNLEGPGSGPGYSLLCCKEHLQRPFYLCNVDTIVEEPYRDLDSDWVGIAYTSMLDQFATVDYCLWSCVSHLLDKGTDFWSHYKLTEAPAYIGLAGIKNWEVFWSALEASITEDEEIQYLEALRALIKEHAKGGLKVYGYKWFDTGSVTGYQETCRAFQGTEVLGLPKNINEITYKVNGRLIKLCLDSMKNSRRLVRGLLLRSVIPTIVYRGLYVMAYKWIDGQTLYDEGCDHDTWLAFVEFCQDEIWWPHRAPEPQPEPQWEDICYGFYNDKTWERLREYLASRGLEHSSRTHINGRYCEPVEAYLTYLDWDNLSAGIPVCFHGDLQFDNALLGDDGRWYLIDWRECFGDSLIYGDLYYDLAKLYSGLDLPYDRLKREEFTFDASNGHVVYRYVVDCRLVAFKEMFESWLVLHGYDLRKVKTLAALIYINMAPLHPGSMGDLLFYHGVFRLALLRDCY